MDLAISRLEHISAGDIGNVHAINAYRMETKPPPPGFSSMNHWSGCSLSQLAMQLVGTMPSQQGRAVAPFQLGLNWTREWA